MVDFQGYVTLFIVWLVSIIVVRTILSKNRSKARLPPSPPTLPIIGHLHLMAPIPHQALHKLANRYGPLMHLSLGSIPCLVASSPETAKELLKTHESSFSNRPKTIAIDVLTYGSLDFNFAPHGPYWKFMKKLCMSELFGGRILEQFAPVRRAEITRLLQIVLEKAKVGEELDIGGEFMKVSNNVISRMSMNRNCCENDEEAHEVRKIVKEMAELAGKFNVSDYIWFCKKLDLQGFGKRLKDVHGRFDAMTEMILKEHEEERKNKETRDGDEYVKDIVDLLLDIMEDSSSEVKLCRENIKAFILDIFVAGTDTSAITTEWALAELINHPAIMNKARKEIDTTVGTKRLVEESDISNLPYLQAIVKETLRLHPTAPLILRQTNENCSIGSYDIPSKTRLFVNVWAIGRDPKYWENPLEFRPERFVTEEGKSQLDVRGQHFQLLPFGSGRRGCPGATLALQVVQMMLASMIQCFEFRVGDNADGKVDMEEGLGMTLPRAHPLVCVPIPRLNPVPCM